MCGVGRGGREGGWGREEDDVVLRRGDELGCQLRCGEEECAYARLVFAESYGGEVFAFRGVRVDGVLFTLWVVSGLFSSESPRERCVEGPGRHLRL